MGTEFNIEAFQRDTNRILAQRCANIIEVLISMENSNGKGKTIRIRKPVSPIVPKSELFLESKETI